MEQISSLLHFDVSKFKDIFNILHKLEEDGVVKEISDLFYKIFMGESKFTLGELVKIQKERSDKINVSKQYENNLSLFKSNFGLIVQLLLDNTFKVIVKENQNKLVKEKVVSGEETETTNQTLEDTQTPRQREKLSSARKNNDSPLLKSKRNKNQTSEQKSATKREQSNSAAVLNEIVSKDIGRQSSRSSKDHEGENSLTQSQQSGSKKRNNNSVVSPLKIPVASEFNHIQGSATFPQSERKFLDVNLNGPGPAFYEVSRASPSHLKRSPSPTIGKAPRQSWIEVSAKTASPGPGDLYPSHHYISK